MLGASGMLGHQLLRAFASAGWDAAGTVRDAAALARMPQDLAPRVSLTGDLSISGIGEAVVRAGADVVVNALGVLKSVEVDEAMAVNGLLPHRLARACAGAGARFVHVSTDCVFSGDRGAYSEDDTADAADLYGWSKRLGEPEAPALVIRTSLIGPELGTRRGLLEWYLGERGPVPGWTRALFSGLPTAVFARVLRDHVLPAGIEGTWHMAAAPISKAALLGLVRAAWPGAASIVPVDRPVIDRSLDGSRLAARIGWTAPPWPEMVAEMRGAW